MGFRAQEWMSSGRCLIETTSILENIYPGLNKIEMLLHQIELASRIAFA